MTALALAACSDSGTSDPGWMAKQADQTSLAALSIPGTHDSAALSEPLAGSAKTQLLNLDQQLVLGVRFFDIRCRDVADAFAIYHGPYDEMQTFDQVLDSMYRFLDHHPTETVLMSIKEEYTEDQATRPYADTFRAYSDKTPSRWYLDDRVPTLGEVRGKIVLVRRFTAATTPLGLDASAWQDNTTFTLTAGQATMRIEDAYVVSSTDTKWMQIQAALDAAQAAPAADDTLYLTFTSGYKSNAGVPNTPSVSTVIDPQLQTYLSGLGAGHHHLGVIAMDFVDGGHATLMEAANDP